MLVRNQRHFDEGVVPFAGVKLFAMLVYRRCDYQLDQTRVGIDGLCRQTRVHHVGDEDFQRAVVNVLKHRLTDIRNQPLVQAVAPSVVGCGADRLSASGSRLFQEPFRLLSKRDRLCRLPNLLSFVNPGSLDYFCCTALLLSFREEVGARTRANLLGFQFTSSRSVNPESDYDPITGLLKASFLKSTAHTATNLSAVRSSSRWDSTIPNLLRRGTSDTGPRTQ